MNAPRRSGPRLSTDNWLTLALGGAAVALILVNLQQVPPAAPAGWFIVLTWTALYAAARFLTSRLYGGDFSFDNVLLLAAFLALGYPAAAGIATAGVVLDELAQATLRRQLKIRRRRAIIVLGEIGRNLACVQFTLGLGALAYGLAGGSVPLSEGALLVGAVPLIVLLAAYGAAAVAIRLLNAAARGPNGRAWRQTARQGLLLDLLPLPLSLVLAMLYATTSSLLLIELALALILAQLVVRRVNVVEAALEQRTRERATVNAVGQAIANSLDLPELLQAIHQHISPLMDARNFQVALYNEDYDELTFPLVFEDGQPGRLRSRTVGNGLIEHVIRSREPLYIPSDVAEAARQLNLSPPPDNQALCWLGVPVAIGDRALGAIVVLSRERADAYTPDDIELLTTIASHMAVAIENAQLYASMRRRAAELAILNSVSTFVGSSLNLDRVMEAIVNSVGPVVGCQKAAILLAREGGSTFTPAASRGISSAFIESMPALMRAARGESAGSAERQPLIVTDARSDPRFQTFRSALEVEGVRAFADMPLQARDHVIGTLAALYTEPHRFTIAELDLLTTFANQAAAAVANAALFAQTDLALARRIEELAALEEIGRELAGTLDFNRVLERVLDAAIELAGASHGLVALVNGERQLLTVVAARGYAPNMLTEDRTRQWLADPAVVPAALRAGEPVWIKDARQHPAYQALDPSIRSALVVPILREGKVAGLINLASERTAKFDSEIAAFIGQLATQAALAIHNAQLHQETQRRLHEMTVLFELSQRATSTLDLPELGRELAAQLASALGATQCTIELIDRAAGAFESIGSYAAADVEPIDLPRTYDGPLQSLNGDELRRHRRPVILHANAAVERQAADDFFGTHRVHALIGLPLIAGDQMIGRVIWLHHQPRPPFGDDDIRLAHTLANQAGIALENTRLFGDRARHVNDLAQLYRASLALASSLEFDEALKRIATIAREITQSDAVTVYLYDARSDRVSVGGMLTGAEQLIDVQAVRPRGMTRHVIATRQPVLVNDTLLAPDMNPRVVEAGIRSVIAMPILLKGEAVGVLYVNSRRPNHYSDDSLQLVQLLSNEAAVTIENARLFSSIADTRDRLAAILHSSRDGVLMFDVAGRIVVANPMLEQLWDQPRDALEGRLLLDLVDSPELDLPARLGYTPAALRRLLTQAIDGGRIDWGKEVFTPPGPREQFVQRTGAPVLDEHGRLVGWMLVLTDVTEERGLQIMREDLTNMIVHDLRSPLVAILDSYELIQESMAPEYRASLTGQALEVGQRSTRKLLDLVNSLLDVSRFEHGALPVDTQFAALRPLMDNAAEQLAATASDRGVQLANAVPDSLPLVKVDEDQITRVLINLIDNAVKFSPAGGIVTVTAQALTNGGEAPPAVVCSVRDQGPGVPAEQRDRIFERFVMLGPGLERRRGTGLGLAFCRLAIEAHGGKIWIEDPPDGAGSQFCFSLPVADVLPSPL